MRAALLAVTLTLGLGACASAPIRSPAVVSLDGEFRGPVVSQRGTPLPARYQGMCESPAQRWKRGGFRTYDCRPGAAVVRAKY